MKLFFSRALFSAFAACLIAFSAAPAFAQKPDPVVDFSTEDEQMNAAIADARRTYPQFLAAFRAAPQGDREYYIVKVGLPTATGELEHIWVDNLRVETGVLVGSLANEPRGLPGQHLGSRVYVRTEEISDWSITRADGMFGNFTTRVMLPHLSPQEAASLREMLSPTPLPADWSS